MGNIERCKHRYAHWRCDGCGELRGLEDRNGLTPPPEESGNLIPASHLEGAVDALLDRLEREGVLRDGMTATDARKLLATTARGQ